MTLNLRQIEVFRAVMDAGSVSGAAQTLHVSAPAVSRLLSYCETKLGFELFKRTRGRLYPTADAHRLYAEVEAVFVAMNRVNEVAHQIAERQAGVLHIVSSPSIGQLLIPQAIANFHELRPEVKLTFQFMNHALLKAQVLDGHADLGVAILPVDHPKLEATSLGQGRLVLICPKGSAMSKLASVTAKQLKGVPLIAYSSASPFGKAIEAIFSQEADSPVVSVEVGSPQNACALVQMGADVALVDEFSVRNWPNPNFAVIPLLPEARLHVSVVYSREAPLSPLAQTFIGELAKLIRKYGFALPSTPSQAATAGP
jgi:DNA-binding transcriptional LysR family regulator